MEKTKTKCVKDFKCEVCGISGMLQVLSERYARVRHYKYLKDGKPQFEYHKQSFQYVQRILNESTTEKKIDLIDLKNIDLKILKSLPNYQNNSCLGSLAWWGIALVRRRSRVQIPPEALTLTNIRRTGLKYQPA